MIGQVKTGRGPSFTQSFLRLKLRTFHVSSVPPLCSLKGNPPTGNNPRAMGYPILRRWPMYQPLWEMTKYVLFFFVLWHCSMKTKQNQYVRQLISLQAKYGKVIVVFSLYDWLESTTDSHITSQFFRRTHCFLVANSCAKLSCQMGSELGPPQPIQQSKRQKAIQ